MKEIMSELRNYVGFYSDSKKKEEKIKKIIKRLAIDLMYNLIENYKYEYLLQNVGIEYFDSCKDTLIKERMKYSLTMEDDEPMLICEVCFEFDYEPLFEINLNKSIKEQIKYNIKEEIELKLKEIARYKEDIKTIQNEIIELRKIKYVDSKR